jgi:sugar lactone lactonase YvrE
MARAKTQKSLNLFLTNLKFQTFLIGFLLIGCLKTNAQSHLDLKARQIAAPECRLGEGAFWDGHRNCLWFVDIENGNVHWFYPGSSKTGKFPCGMKIGTLVPSEKKDLLVLGLQDGIYRSELKGGGKQKISKPELLNSNQRLNDGKCDPQGRLWVGSMNLDKQSRKAHLFRIDSKGKSVKILDSVSISNGIAWTKDGKTMFYIDTPTRTVMAYDFQGTDGSISNPRVLVTVPDSLGWPDGMTLDENDNLWIGMWGGYCVSHWSVKDGAYLGKVRVPAPNVTSCAFGGPNFETLYITSAKEGLKEEQLLKFPASGNLFGTNVGVKGRQMPYWNGN